MKRSRLTAQREAQIQENRAMSSDVDRDPIVDARQDFGMNLARFV